MPAVTPEPDSAPSAATGGERWRKRWETAARSPHAAAGVLLFFVIVYLATATYGSLQSIDTIAAAIPAQQIVEEGTLRVDEYADATPWFLPGRDGGVYSNRFPGTILAGVPFYAMAHVLGAGRESLSYAPAGVAAAFITAGAIALLFLTFRRISRPEVALAGAVVAGLGTGTWTVSADALWSHGPGQLLMAASMLAWPVQRYASAGALFALSILTRPQLAVVPLVTGVAEGWRRRSIRPVLIIGLLSSAGVALLMLYNNWVFAEAAVDAQRPYVEQRLAGIGIIEYFRGWILVLASPVRGIFVYSPFLLVLVPGLRRAWLQASPWTRTAAVSGAAYLGVQLAVNEYGGGSAFFSYRLPLEALTLMAPLFVLAYECWACESRGLRRAVALAAVWSLLVHLFGAIAYMPLIARYSG